MRNSLYQAGFLFSGLVFNYIELFREGNDFPPRGIILIIVLAGWVAAVPILGFNIGCLVFFPLLFYVSGYRPWLKSIAAGVIMALVFYAIFVLGAKLPVPTGMFGI